LAAEAQLEGQVRRNVEDDLFDGCRKHRVHIRVNRAAALPKAPGAEEGLSFGVRFHSINR
jgi:hypothetical protein